MERVFQNSGNISSVLTQVHNHQYLQRYDSQFINDNDKILYGWKEMHDEVPRLVSDQFALKVRILEVAGEFGLGGDIELDRGFSFSYQVTVFFPPRF